MSYYLYILIHNIHNKTYCGITNNLKRRIRQHNAEIKGGARYTTANLSNGTWSYYIIVKNLTKSQALSYEWKIHHTKGLKGTPLEKRIQALKKYNINYEFFIPY